MANHKSALKRIRSNQEKHLRNRYHLKTCKTFIKKLMNFTDGKEANVLLPKIFAMIDKLTSRNIIHKNNGAHKKSKLAKYVNSLPCDMVVG